MNWFNRWFAKKCEQAWNSKKICGDMLGSQPTVEVAERELGDRRRSMHLQIHPATGGYILEFSRYNRTKDEHHRNLHIITEDQNLGEAIAQIITIEMLRS